MRENETLETVKLKENWNKKEKGGNKGNFSRRDRY